MFMFLTHSFKSVITSKKELRNLKGTPSERAQQKVIHHIDGHCKNFIAFSPFLVISTADGNGNCEGFK